jgi:hypothetical protein
MMNYWRVAWVSGAHGVPICARCRGLVSKQIAACPDIEAACYAL